jgi:hypothetical protein
MEPKDTLLTTKEFASRSGMTVAQVTKLLRENKIRGEKQSGRWMIPASALNAGDSPSPPAKAKAKKPAQTARKSRRIPCPNSAP